MLIAVEGCCHGELDNIYASIEDAQRRMGHKVDLLLCCGDFQAVRNKADLSTMACPDKYKSMRTFYKYYKGEKVAPVLTIVIGGNHEASNYMWELPYGGWVAPNIYYLGFAGAVCVNGIRIGGLSGIYNSRHYNIGHFEAPPFSEGTKRSIYHVREIDAFQLKQLSHPVDVFLSHDWPTRIAFHGDTDELIRKKSFLRDEIYNETLGSPPGEELLKALQPSFWFCAHMHVKFAAVVRHGAEAATARQPIHGGDDGDGGEAEQQQQQQQSGGEEGTGGGVTRFLALDKCLPRRSFLQLITIDDKDNSGLCYDLEWLTVLRKTHSLRSTKGSRVHIPRDSESSYRPTAAELSETAALFKNSTPKIPLNFKATVPAHPANTDVGPHANTQTEELCALLGIPNPCRPFIERKKQQQQQQQQQQGSGLHPTAAGSAVYGGGQGMAPAPLISAPPMPQPLLLPPPATAAADMDTHNPAEIPLDDEDDEDHEQGDGAGGQDTGMSLANRARGQVGTASRTSGLVLPSPSQPATTATTAGDFINPNAISIDMDDADDDDDDADEAEDNDGGDGDDGSRPQGKRAASDTSPVVIKRRNATNYASTDE